MADRGVQISVIVPRDVHENLERAAKADRRPLSSYARNLLEDAVADRERRQERAEHAA